MTSHSDVKSPNIGSDNAIGAVNQQETGNGILRDCTPGASNTRQVGDAMRQSEPYGDIGRTAEMTVPLRHVTKATTELSVNELGDH